MTIHTGDILALALMMPILIALAYGEWKFGEWRRSK